MIILFIAFCITASKAAENLRFGATPYLAHINELNIGAFKDAEHRGPQFYNYNSESESGSNIDTDSGSTSASSSESSRSSDDNDDSTSASSVETKERKWSSRVYRVCKPCPTDMIKKYVNLGIKWICGGYQRARRSFKSGCMMRYRNCEDGTMFKKIHGNRCKNDTYHGNHWFYVYKT